MHLTATAPGKLVLIGEYAVLEGGLGLVMAVGQKARVTLEAHPTAGIVCIAKDIGVQNAKCFLNDQGHLQWHNHVTQTEREKLSLVATCLQTVQAFSKIPSELFGHLRIEIDTHDFLFESTKTKLGLGSSASVAVALIAGLFHLFDHQQPNLQSVFSLAFKAHQTWQQGIGSGIDIATSTFGGLFTYWRGSSVEQPQIKKVDWPNELSMVCVYGNKSASTCKLVGHTQLLKQHDPKIYHALMQQLCACSKTGIGAFEKADTRTFCSAVQQFGCLMQELGRASKCPIISHEHTEARGLIERENGVYKPSGAGGGDLGLGFFAWEKAPAVLVKTLAKQGFSCIPVALEHRGVTCTTSQ